MAVNHRRLVLFAPTVQSHEIAPCIKGDDSAAGDMMIQCDLFDAQAKVVGGRIDYELITDYRWGRTFDFLRKVV